MPLNSEAQYVALGSDITVTHAAEFASALAIRDYPGIAQTYNQVDASNFWVWRSVLPPEEYTGAGGIVWTEVDALTVGKARIFEWMTGTLTKPLHPSDSNQRQGIQDAFQAQAPTTFSNLRTIARRLARRIERLYVTGTGSTASPGSLGFEGTVTDRDVAHAVDPTVPL